MTDPRILDLMTFIDASVVNFLAAKEITLRLEGAGFKRLDASKPWDITPGTKAYIVKNHSAVFAFIAGKGAPNEGYKIISAHSDSPCFRLKPHCEIVCDGGIVKLNTEVYGGPILYTWFDRPLSLAGRVLLRSLDPMHPDTRLVRFDSPLCTIPHLAIHYNRQVNDGNPLSRQKDMLPVMGRVPEGMKAETLVCDLVAHQLDVDPRDILDYDLSLYDTTKATLVGLDDDFITSGRLDDLSMVHAALTALTEYEGTPRQTLVMAIFDNEETGSGTKQGAASPVLAHMLTRICTAMGGSQEDWLRGLDQSFMVSADNAHGVHPNYAEKQDPTNHPVLGGGPCIKINANCKYMTDADSAAVFASICRDAGVPYQYFVNHSDVAGGSTLGNILTSQIDLRGVDMGAPLWAMHSVRETASPKDHIYTIGAFKKFYELV